MTAEQLFFAFFAIRLLKSLSFNKRVEAMGFTLTGFIRLIVYFGCVLGVAERASAQAALNSEGLPVSIRQNQRLPQSLDARLRQVIEQYGLTSPRAVQIRPGLYQLGRRLFFDPNLSGPRDIACATCHHPQLGGGDGLPLSIGTGGRGLGPQRMRMSAGITFRHSPTLFNLRGGLSSMFWDGRVSQRTNGDFVTPEPQINGPNPPRRDIKMALSSALAAQTLFPMVNPVEMLGAPGANDISNQATVPQMWDAIVKRLLTEKIQFGSQAQQLTYLQLFRNAYPQMQNLQQINIGHVGTALAHFIEVFFNSTNTPFDRYISGHVNALNLEQKVGMDLFFRKGACGSCHHGPDLGQTTALNVATPQFWSRSYGQKLDLGRGFFGQDPRLKFSFKTPGLRNLVYTAPYMHNGAFPTLRSVLEHYNDVRLSLRRYSPPASYSSLLGEPIGASSSQSADQVFNSVLHPAIKQGLGLTVEELRALEAFLSQALTDLTFDQKRP